MSRLWVVRCRLWVVKGSTRVGVLEESARLLALVWRFVRFCQKVSKSVKPYMRPCQHQRVYLSPSTDPCTDSHPPTFLFYSGSDPGLIDDRGVRVRVRVRVRGLKAVLLL